MDNITLTLRAYHLSHLREAVRAWNQTIQADSASTVTDKTVCADLEARVDLLARAVATEHVAREARKQYNMHVYNTPQPSGQRKRKEARKLDQEPPHDVETMDTSTTDNMQQEPPPEPMETATETATTSSADVVKRTI